MKTKGIFILTFFLFFSCENQEKKQKEFDDLSNAILAFMECIECTDGELEKLKSFGETSLPFLNEIVMQGPSLAKLELEHQQLKKLYAEIKIYGDKHPKDKVTLTENQFIYANLLDYKTGYQKKAIYALASIGGEKSKKILENALTIGKNKKWRSNILTAIDNAIKSIK